MFWMGSAPSGTDASRACLPVSRGIAPPRRATALDPDLKTGRCGTITLIVSGEGGSEESGPEEHFARREPSSPRGPGSGDGLVAAVRGVRRRRTVRRSRGVADPRRRKRRCSDRRHCARVSAQLRRLPRGARSAERRRRPFRSANRVQPQEGSGAAEDPRQGARHRGHAASRGAAAGPGIPGAPRSGPAGLAPRGRQFPPRSAPHPDAAHEPLPVQQRRPGSLRAARGRVRPAREDGPRVRLLSP